MAPQQVDAEFAGPFDLGQTHMAAPAYRRGWRRTAGQGNGSRWGYEPSKLFLNSRLTSLSSRSRPMT